MGRLLAGKNILLGVSAGIAAYKAPQLVRDLRAAGANVRVIMSKNAKQLVAPLALQAVSGYPVQYDLMAAEADFAMDHIELARWADIYLIAPATANCIAKLAHGVADDLVTTIALATTATVAIAPAMNLQMWHHLATQDNLQILRSRGVIMFGPDCGEQACGDVGIGRMRGTMDLVADLGSLQVELRSLCGRKVVITAGATVESLDPVRYLSNRSTGRMGYALAGAAVAAGADVTLISGPTFLEPASGVTLVEVESAKQMHAAVMAGIDCADIYVGAAAVADYTPGVVADEKIKKQSESMVVTLSRTADIIADVAALRSRPFVVGFAAETNLVLENAKKKLKDKAMDLIVANKVGSNQGFGNGAVAVVVVDSNNEQISLAANDKRQLAPILWKEIVSAYERAAMAAL